MVLPVKRRQANVEKVRQLISGIKYIRSQKQISNLERLARYMEREHHMPQSETEQQLNSAVLDNLILSYTGVGFKGSKTGVEYEGFRIPDPGELEADDDGHDWYCFECHEPGLMYACSDCWRVFHADCQDEDTDDVTYTCAVCKSARKKKKTKRKLLNTLLSYTIVRLKEKTRELHSIGHREEEKYQMSMFVYKAMDLNKMEQKVMVCKYTCIEEFLADAHTILHNMVLIYGDDAGGMTELARVMICNCKYDIDEMAQCQNCYYMSNAKPQHWFAQPCAPPHELVYAKLKGYCFWPAKVINYVSDDKYDVRFFGGLHQRALIPKDQIKPIDTDAKSLHIKRTSAFTKAEQELAIHRELLQAKKDAGEDEEEDEEEDAAPFKLAQRRDSMDDIEIHKSLIKDVILIKELIHTKVEDPEIQVKEKKRSEEEKMEAKVPDCKKEEKKQKRKKKKYLDEKHLKDMIESDTVSSSIITTTKHARDKKVSPPEDFVTSTEEYAPVNKKPCLSTNTTASQTSKDISLLSTEVASTQTDDLCIETMSSENKSSEIPVIQPFTSARIDEAPVLESCAAACTMICDCEAKYKTMLREMKEKLDKEHREGKQMALDELSERLHKDFEEDKQQAVSRAMNKLQTELERMRRQTEEKCKEQYKDEMKKLAQKHKETISATKKKQWCYNCEEEAMYHCCWNTSYCSVHCQQEHWHKEHKRVCRRKR